MQFKRLFDTKSLALAQNMIKAKQTLSEKQGLEGPSRYCGYLDCYREWICIKRNQTNGMKYETILWYHDTHVRRTWGDTLEQIFRVFGLECCQVLFWERGPAMALSPSQGLAAGRVVRTPPSPLFTGST